MYHIVNLGFVSETKADEIGIWCTEHCRTKRWYITLSNQGFQARFRFEEDAILCSLRWL